MGAINTDKERDILLFLLKLQNLGRFSNIAILIKENNVDKIITPILINKGLLERSGRNYQWKHSHIIPNTKTAKEIARIIREKKNEYQRNVINKKKLRVKIDDLSDYDSIEYLLKYDLNILKEKYEKFLGDGSIITISAEIIKQNKVKI